ERRLRDQARQLVQLALATDEARQLDGKAREPTRRCGRGGGFELVTEDLLLEESQLLTRLEPKPLGEQHACPLVGGKGIGLATRAVQRGHQLAPEALAQWLLGEQHLQLGDELLMSIALKVGLDPLLECLQAELLQTCCLRTCEQLVREFSQRTAVP